MDINVGDRVQIKEGGLDVTNGNKARAGRYYGQGGPLWCTVESIDKNWRTNGKFGLPASVTKVRCSNNGIIVWQVRPQDIADNVIHSSKPETVQKKSKKEEKKEKLNHKTETKSKDTEIESKPKIQATITEISGSSHTIQTAVTSYAPYAIKKGSSIWQQDGQLHTKGYSTGRSVKEATPDQILIGSNAMDKKGTNPVYVNHQVHKKNMNIRSKNVKLGYWKHDEIDDEWDYIKNPIQEAKFPTAWEDPLKQRQMLNEDYENIQNSAGFPAFPYNYKRSDIGLAAKYDYRIIPGDPRYSGSQSLEDKLRDARASLGIHVHGNNNIARAVKYYMYNRFKSPDTNLLFNRATTHVFFTRPDLNLLLFNDTDGKCIANQQAINHSESSMIYRRYPELFKLLTDYRRCKDANNFNMLLSQQVSSFDIIDETLTTNDVGKSWNDHNMIYGNSCDGKKAGEFSCNFIEVSDFSVITLLKLWITYIDNVSNGTWSPSYNLLSTNPNAKPSKKIDDSYVYTKTLDYAASAYVFKCDPTGDNILYWSKYYGIFPVNTGASALSWNNEDPIGSSPKLNIRFKYCFKRDLSPISLIEFNHNANMSLGTYENSYNEEYAGSSRPFVGCPFVELKLASPSMRPNGVNYESEVTSIKLKFKHTSDNILTDDLLYRTNMTGNGLYDVIEELKESKGVIV